MEYRTLGSTGLKVSLLGFGCGNVGGLMIRGTPAERERAVARAMDLGVNYFDTAPLYGDGQSETNLGATLAALRADVLVGTKVRVRRDEHADIAGAIERSLEASLGRMGRDRVDLFQLHNMIGPQRSDNMLTLADMDAAVVPAFERLRAAGKIRHFGITALGDTDALHATIGAGRIQSAQVCYNLLNPSAGARVPATFAAQDFRDLLGAARSHGVGVIVIRVLAAGALSGEEARHPVAVPSVAPIASGPDYSSDVAQARRLAGALEEARAEDLVELSLRFAVGHPAVSTVLLGYSSLDHLEHAARAIAKGALPAAATARLDALRRSA
jgi:L-galactose dehydrogenase/L-glyceraldehyde 3-phosphate reductase